MKLLSKYKYTILIAIIIALIIALYMAITWRDQIACLGECNWEKIELTKNQHIAEAFGFGFTISFIPLLILGILINYLVIKYKNGQKE
tara:strand:+ start:169 stop:432 length:264 start_codon:yes stop_codon:yes gene_type:complete